MRVASGPAAAAEPHVQIGTSVRPSHLVLALAAVSVFGLYWLSSHVIESRDKMHLFGADTGLYWQLANADAIDRLGADAYLARITRFHPVTTLMAVGWMKILGPLAPWVTPHQLLKAMFAAVGALGVWAAMWAFAAAVSRRYVMVLGAIYATSLGVWYFSSIEESKIVSATLAALYIAIYLHLRTRWTMRGAVLLTAILLLACLNEILAGFLVVIPVVDTLVQRGWDLRHGWWIALHALAAPLALVFLEVVVNGRLVPAGADPEGATHLSMLLYYLDDNDFSAATAYSFLANWVLFNVAAPTRDASYVYSQWPNYQAYFEPKLANYLSSPVSAALVAVFAVMLVASILPRYRNEGAHRQSGILLALFTYTLLRGIFFFIFNPYECLLFSPSVTLAHLLLIGIPFTVSSFPAKRGLLAGFAALLLLTNGAFIFGR